MQGRPNVLLWLAIAAAASLCPPQAGAQMCEAFWGAGAPVPPGNIYHESSTVAFDDGTGPAIFASWTRSGGLLHAYRWREGEPAWTMIDAGLPASFNVGQVLVLDDGGGPRLYADGWVDNAPYASGVARWNGSSWDMLSPLAVSPIVHPRISVDLGDGMAIYGERIINTQGGQVVKWDGGQWVPFGAQANGTGMVLSVLDTPGGKTLYMTGGFTSIGGVPAPWCARWDGQRWVAAGDGTTMAFARPAITFDDGTGPALWGRAGGVLNGQPYTARLGRFDGAHWSVYGGSSGQGITSVFTCDLLDTGSGPAFYMGGTFGSFGGVPASNIARYDFHTWSAVGAGVNGTVYVSTVLPGRRGPTLYLLGTFTEAGGGLANLSAAVVGCPNCYANCDSSRTAPALNISDYICFLNAFARRDPYANCDGSTAAPVLNVSDFVCFMGRFAGGCQ